MTKTSKVAVIDDDKLSSHNLNVILRFIGEELILLDSKRWRQSFLDAESSKNIFILIIGTLKNKDIAELLDDIRQWHDNMPLILSGSVEEFAHVDAALKQNVIAIMKRPFNYQDLIASLNTAREGRGLKKPVMKSSLLSENGTPLFRSLVGGSQAIVSVRNLIQQLANKHINVLVQGESGTGKEIVARNLHYNSGRGSKPFVTINCATIGLDMLSREFYGQEQWVDGTQKILKGFFERADEGTLFFDKIEDMPMAAQALLQRFLEEPSFQRPGGTELVQANVRIIAATHHDLEERVSQGLFREDLFYRINAFPIEIPPLRERQPDIPDLISELIVRLENQSSASVRFNSAALVSLQRHSWPGNVRELANLVERLAIINPNGIVGLSDLPRNYQHIAEGDMLGEEHTEKQGKADRSITVKDKKSETSPALLQAFSHEKLQAYLKNFEKNLIEVALDDCASVLSLTAERLNLSPEALRQKIEQHALHGVDAWKTPDLPERSEFS
ncbi:MAG: sigma-54 dependent transcriptional regulator [Pseudomonadales bacterium]|nr:sigma-54 dependent transcriptional regulator [Pseudomonadales bacterium]